MLPLLKKTQQSYYTLGAHALLLLTVEVKE